MDGREREYCAVLQELLTGDSIVVSLLNMTALQQGNHWLHNEVCLLLDLYREHLHLLKDPCTKKSTVWCLIANLLHKTPEACDKKFRDLKSRFMKIKENPNPERRQRRWEYFDIMEELLTGDPDDIKHNSIAYDQETVHHSIASQQDNNLFNHWIKQDVYLLLDLYKQHLHLFEDPCTKKYEVWRQIAAALSKTPEACDKKFRDLKTRYKRITIDKSGSARKKWEYFDIMQELLGGGDEGDDSMHHEEALPQGYEPLLQVSVQSPVASPESSGLTPSTSRPGTPTFKANVSNPDVVSKCKKRKFEEPPDWFQEFCKDQTSSLEKISQQLETITTIQREMVEVQKTRNSILKDLHVTLSKNKT